MTRDRREEADAIEALLPWYAAGTLDPGEAKRVEEALARRPDLRASLEIAREDRDETIALNEALGAPGTDVWTRVLAVAQAEPRKPSLKARLAALVGLGAERHPGRLAWAAAAAAIVIALQAATILSLLPAAKGPGYQTASQASATPEGASVLVSFAPDARLDQVGLWLQQHHASIVEGPRGGMYRVRVGDKSLTKDQVAALAAELAATPLVHMVLPATGE
ncbi:MAG: zf-HC2 domain-containing protein [Roseiarcus sp.]